MKKIVSLLLLTSLSLLAKDYYSKAAPYEIYIISSNVSGEVTYADEKRAGQLLGSGRYLKIDDKLDQVELKSIESKVVLFENTLKLNESMLKNYEEMLQKKQTNYENIKSLKTKSTIEKDREFYDLVTTQNQYIATQKEIDNLKISINDLKLRIAQLKKSISDKSFRAKGKVLYSLNVKEGQVVSPGMELAKIADVSKAKLTIYLNATDMKDARQKTLYINGKKSKYKITRVWNIADATHLSSYKAEIIIDRPEQFSQLIKVELK